VGFLKYKRGAPFLRRSLPLFFSFFKKEKSKKLKGGVSYD
jgi:hypothetical protein